MQYQRCMEMQRFCLALGDGAVQSWPSVAVRFVSRATTLSLPYPDGIQPMKASIHLGNQSTYGMPRSLVPVGLTLLHGLITRQVRSICTTGQAPNHMSRTHHPTRSRPCAWITRHPSPWVPATSRSKTVTVSHGFSSIRAVISRTTNAVLFYAQAAVTLTIALANQQLDARFLKT